MSAAPLQDPESVRIAKLKYSRGVVKSIRGIHDRFRESRNDPPVVLVDKNVGPDMECNFFRGLKFENLRNYLDERRLELRGPKPGADGEFPYWVYAVPEKYVGMINVILDADCKAYHRIYLQTPDGIVNRDFGELRPHECK